jgi:hypothetical protein
LEIGLNTITEKLNTHLALSLTMLRNIAENCPENLWIKDNENESIWKRLLHVLESMDFWLDDFSEYHFNRIFDTFSAEMDTCNKSVLSKKDIFRYLDLLQTKIKGHFENMDDSILTESSGKHPRATYLDIILSQIRHIHNNIGYCNEKFTRKGIKSPEWLGYNEESEKENK